MPSKKNTAHHRLIHTMMSFLPLQLTYTLYKCLLSETERVLKRAQPASSNVGVDILNIKPLVEEDGTECHTYNSKEYQQVLETLGNQWERATKTSRQAVHMLAVTDNATIVGKLRSNRDKWAYGSFDQALATFKDETTPGAENCALDFSKGVTLPIKKVKEVPDTEGVPVESMGKAVNTMPDPLPEHSAPQEVINYAVF